jgi:predicted nucleotidyltransferase
MLKNLKNYSILSKIAKKIRSDDIVDIILFGSSAKGKKDPKDIDISVIFRNKINLELNGKINEEYEKKDLNVHVSSLTVDDFFTKPISLMRSIFFEGISLLNKKRILENYGLTAWSIYNYNLTNLKKSDRVRFVYLLKGREKEEGLIKTFKGNFLAPGCFMVPIEKDNEVLEILNKWKIIFKRKKCMLMD